MLGRPKTVEEQKEELFTRQTKVVRDQPSYSAAELGAELLSAPEYSPHSKSLADAFQAVDAASAASQAKKTSTEVTKPVSAAPAQEKRSVYAGFGSLFRKQPTSAPEPTKAGPTTPAARSGFKGPNSSQGG